MDVEYKVGDKVVYISNGAYNMLGKKGKVLAKEYTLYLVEFYEGNGRLHDGNINMELGFKGKPDHCWWCEKKNC